MMKSLMERLGLGYCTKAYVARKVEVLSDLPTQQCTISQLCLSQVAVTPQQHGTARSD